jgi:ABC-type branched-subunit amino acid transport system ATPase component
LQAKNPYPQLKLHRLATAKGRLSRCRAYVLGQGGVVYQAAAHELLADNDIKARYCSV